MHDFLAMEMIIWGGGTYRLDILLKKKYLSFSSMREGKKAEIPAFFPSDIIPAHRRARHS